MNKRLERDVKTAVIGIGHEFREDDVVGLDVVRGIRPFAPPHLLCVEGGHAPENCTGKIRAFNPDWVILVDAAFLDCSPGSVHWLQIEEAAGLSATTHTLPLDMLGLYLKTTVGCEISLIGIQPETINLGDTISSSVAFAADEIIQFFHILFVDEAMTTPMKTTS
ncbi:MAG: hydrogenase maturation protease [Chloroflexi bacterium]|nr:hydrogenase maturation protease [Chloroflexota bacterium]